MAKYIGTDHCHQSTSSFLADLVASLALVASYHLSIADAKQWHVMSDMGQSQVPDPQASEAGCSCGGVLG
jgi:hypothetical protein